MWTLYDCLSYKLQTSFSYFGIVIFSEEKNNLFCDDLYSGYFTSSSGENLVLQIYRYKIFGEISFFYLNPSIFEFWETAVPCRIFLSSCIKYD